MNFMGIIAGIIIFFILVIVVLTVLVAVKPEIFSKNKWSDKVVSSEAKESDTSYTPGNEVIGDTKSFFPVKAFYDRAIGFGNYNYRAIIEVSSINYTLLSDEEQRIVDISYQRFLNSLNFPIEIYIQTQEFDSYEIMHNLEANIKEALRKFPHIGDYAEQYYYELSDVTNKIGNSKMKKKYIIVAYNSSDLLDVSELTSYEIEEFALEELRNRCYIVMGGLNGIGLKTELLNKEGIAEVLYGYYHRDTHRIARDFLSGDYTSAIVTGNTEKPSKIEDFNNIIDEAENRININMLDSEANLKEINLYKSIIAHLEELKRIPDMALNSDEATYNSILSTIDDGFNYRNTAPSVKSEYIAPSTDSSSNYTDGYTGQTALTQDADMQTYQYSNTNGNYYSGNGYSYQGQYQNNGQNTGATQYYQNGYQQQSGYSTDEFEDIEIK